jgi:peptide deformylase
MAILPITIYGDAILRKKAQRVEKIDAETRMLIKDMFRTMDNASGVGLAANQVGSNKAIFVIDVSEVEGLEHIKPFVCINPRIVEKSEELVKLDEGCLSIPGIKEAVLRPKGIKLLYQNEKLEDCEITDESFLARVLQHEYDHLQGVFFTDLVDEESKKILKKQLIRIKKRDFDCDYPVTDID